MTRLPLRSYWHRRIRAARDPVSQVTRAFDYLRAVAKHAEPHVLRRVIPPLTEEIRRAADDLEAALPREGRT